MRGMGWRILVAQGCILVAQGRILVAQGSNLLSLSNHLRLGLVCGYLRSCELCDSCSDFLLPGHSIRASAPLQSRSKMWIRLCKLLIL